MDDRLVFTDDRLILFFNFLLMQSISHSQASRVEMKDNQWHEVNQNDVVLLQVGDEGMPVEELANRLAVPPGEVVKILFMKGIMVQVNQVRGLLHVARLRCMSRGSAACRASSPPFYPVCDEQFAMRPSAQPL